MTTVVNNPGREGSSAGLIIGLILAAIIIFLVIRFGLPALGGGGGGGADINVSVPAAQ